MCGGKERRVGEVSRANKRSLRSEESSNSFKVAASKHPAPQMRAERHEMMPDTH